MAIIDDMIVMLNTVYQDNINDQSTFKSISEIGRALAGIGGLVYIGKSIIGQIARNESINFIPLVRPLFFILAIAWSSEICDNIDSITGLISKDGSKSVESMKAEYAKMDKKMENMITAKWNKINTDQATYDAEYGDGAFAEDGSGLGLSKDFAVGFGRMKDQFIAGILDVLTTVMQWINYLAFMAMYIISFLFRICLRAIAPIAIGIAIFDGFSNNAIEWLGKYINYALLPAIANVYGALSMRMLTGMMDSFTTAGVIGNENAKNVSMSVATFGGAYVAILAILLVGWFFIPTIANMVVSVGGSSAAVQGFAARSAALSSAAGKGVSSAGKGGMMAGGGIAGAGKGLVSGFKSTDSQGNSQQGGVMGAMGGAFSGMASGAARTNLGMKAAKKNFSYNYGSGQFGKEFFPKSKS